MQNQFNHFCTSILTSCSPAPRTNPTDHHLSQATPAFLSQDEEGDAALGHIPNISPFLSAIWQFAFSPSVTQDSLPSSRWLCSHVILPKITFPDGQRCLGPACRPQGPLASSCASSPWDFSCYLYEALGSESRGGRDA